MKKKEFHSRLKLGKKVISNLQQNSIQGGTDTIVRTVTYVIVKTVKITIELFTRPEICPLSHNCVTNLTCVPDACDF